MMSWTVLSRPVRAFGHSSERLARVFVLLVCASVLGITGWRVHLARELELSESRVATANLARAVAEHARAVTEVADIVVAGVVELTEADGTGTVALEQLRLHMAARVGAVARLHELSVHGPAGEWLASSLPTAPGGSVSDRVYFAHHRDSPGRGLFVGLPVQSRTGRSAASPRRASTSTRSARSTGASTWAWAGRSRWPTPMGPCWCVRRPGRRRWASH